MACGGSAMASHTPSGHGQTTYQPAYHEPIDQQEITSPSDNPRYMSHQQSYGQLAHQDSMYWDAKHQQGRYQAPISPQPLVNENLSSTYYEQPKRSFYYQTVRFAFRLGEWWIPEITSFVVAGALFGIYWHLLNAFKDQPLSDWDNVRGVSNIFKTLPSAIAFLTALMRGAMVFPVASAIGQWKWHRYARQPRRLVEFERFDKASRGIMGSISFIFSRNVWHPATVGCIITIASVFFGPFLQNTVSQELWSEYVTNMTACLPVTSVYNEVMHDGDSIDDPRWMVADPAIQASIGRGWFFGAGQELADSDMSSLLHSECPTSECSWDSYSSLYLYHACQSVEVDVKEEVIDDVATLIGTSAAANVSTLHLANEAHNLTTPTRLRTRISRNIPKASTYAAWVESVAILAHLGFIGDFEGIGSDIQAVECVFYWAASRGFANYTKGNLTNTLQETYWDRNDPGVPPTDDFANVTITAPWPCHFNSSSSDSPAEDTCDFSVTANAQRGLFNSLTHYLNGMTADFDGGEDANGNTVTVAKSTSQFTDIFFWSWIIRRSNSGTAEGSLLAVSNMYAGNLVYFLSAAFRNRSPSGEMSVGHVSIPVVHFTVNRTFLIMPGTMLALSVIFFVFAVIWTWNEQAWRNSQLPLFFHGLATTGHHEWDAMKMTSMWEAAYDTRVKLESADGGPGQRLQRYRDDPGPGLPLTGYARVAESMHVSEESQGPAHKGTWGSTTTWSSAKV